LDDLREGLRILKEEAVSWFVHSTDQASLLKYKIQLNKLDHQLQGRYREIGERLFLKLSAGGEKILTSEPAEMEEELTSDKELRRLFDAVANLEQEKKELLEEMEEMR
jgi:hypothetical protein